jgi:hypothetical protein
MSSMMEKLTGDVSKIVISQIVNKLLPVISKKYNIPVNELVETVNSTDGKDTTIKATPNAKPTSSKGGLTDLQKKIDNAVGQEKVFNISTGRPLADTPANRKKYKFFDDFHIAGTANDEKLTNALKMFGAPTKKEIPIHVQAANAKKRAQVDDYMEDSDEDVNNEKENVGKKMNEIKKKTDDKEEVNNKKNARKDSDDKEEVKKKNAKKDSNDKEEVNNKKNAKKDSNDKEEVKKKNAKKDSNDKEEEPKEIKKKRKNKMSEDMDAVLKLSELAEDKAKTADLAYNKSIKQWWNKETGYVFKRKGIRNIAMGKLDSDRVIPLTKKDIEYCKKRQWQSDTTLLKIDDESSEDEN